MNYDMNRLQSERESLDMISLQLDQTLADVEKLVILKTLRAKGFNRTHAAKSLGIGIRTLQRKLKIYGPIPDDPIGRVASNPVSLPNVSCN